MLMFVIYMDHCVLYRTRCMTKQNVDLPLHVLLNACGNMGAPANGRVTVLLDRDRPGPLSERHASLATAGVRVAIVKDEPIAIYDKMRHQHLTAARNSEQC